MSIFNISVAAPQCGNPFTGGPSLSDVCSPVAGTLFLSTLNTLLSNSPQIGEPCERITPITSFDSSYDFIVVGGGAAGAVVASRLSEIKGWNVLLVEAGPDEPAGIEVPANLLLFEGTKLDWNLTTSNESYACLSQGGKCAWPRAKALGGTTLFHGMAYHRGHPKDFEKWVEMGNKGWGWEDVLPYYLKSEDNREIGRVSRKYHATGGLMTVERFPDQPKFANYVLEAATEVGFGTSEDLVGKQITGFTVAQTISRNGVRLSSSRAFLIPAANRTNLHVALNAYVTKVITHKQKVTGIEVTMNGKKKNVGVNREVILSAGTIMSPHLLLLSGIGPKEHLESKNIKVVKDLPGVGENLHNHQSYALDFTLNQPNVPLFNDANAQRYVLHQNGPMSSTGMAQVTGILASNLTTADDPDIQIFFAGFQAICKSKLQFAELQTGGSKAFVRMTSVNVHPTSRGRISLNSSDPFDPPIIWSNDIATEHDRNVIIQGLHAIMKLANSKTMKRQGLRLQRVKIPACKKFKPLSDKFWDCALRWDTRPENHQTGTCKMGPSTDPMAVVDQRLRVYGVKGLRVADASSQPLVVSGNPVASVHMMGERVADFIKEDYGVL